MLKFNMVFINATKHRFTYILPFDEMVDPKLKTESWFEFKLSMEPIMPPPEVILSVLCLPPGFRSTRSSRGGTCLS